MSKETLRIDDIIETLQKAKEQYGNLPLVVDIDVYVPDKDINVWNVKDIIVDDESVTLYNY